MDAAERREKWRIYEQVAGDLLKMLGKDLGLGLVDVKGKKKLEGEISGTEWEIDRLGIAEDGQKVVAIECRRYTRDALTQNAIAALAYIIRDVGAVSGIVVSPKGVQEGGEKIAAKEGIAIVRLDKDATTTDFLLRSMGRWIAGRSANLSGTGILSATAVAVTPPS